MTKAIGIGVVLVIITSVFWACISLNTAVPIRIGFILPLSGPAARDAEATRYGAELAAQELSSVALTFYDSEFDRDVARTIMENHVLNDNLDALYSSFTFITEVVSPLAAAHSTPLFYDSCNCTFAEENPLAFQNYFDPRQECRQIAERARDGGVGKVAHLSIDTDYARYCEDELITVLGPENVLSERTSTTNPFDAYEFLERVHDFGAETVALVPLIPRYDPLFAANQGRGFDTEFFCYEGACMLEGLQSQYPDAILTNVYTFEVPVKDAFVSKLTRDDFHSEHILQAALAYDAVQYTYAAAQVCGEEISPECFVDAVKNNTTYESVLDSTGFDQDGFLQYTTEYTLYTDGQPNLVEL